MRTPPHLSIEQQLNPAWRTACLFFSMVGSGLWEVGCFGGDHGCLQTHKYTVVSRKLFFLFL
jgi:hypothetical protein